MQKKTIFAQKFKLLNDVRVLVVLFIYILSIIDFYFIEEITHNKKQVKK